MARGSRGGGVKGAMALPSIGYLGSIFFIQSKHLTAFLETLQLVNFGISVLFVHY